MKRWIPVWLFLAGIVGLVAAAPSVWAAEFSPTLEEELRQAGAKDMVSAIVILESPIDIQALDDQLHMRQATKAERNKEVLDALQYNANQTQPAFRAEFDDAIKRGEMAGYTPYWIENLFVIQATREFIEALRDRGDVKYVTENFRAELIEPIRYPEKEGVDHSGRNPLDTMTLPPGVQAMGAYRVNTELGITGVGVLVGNCDTGVLGTHAALQSRWRGNFAPWYHCWKDDLGTGTQTPNDGYGHGTHVMGTMAGRAIVGADTQWIGCAPDARWIATNAINQGVGAPFDNDVISDYQWFANPDSNNGTTDDVPDVVQNSWGVFTGLGYVQCFDYWNTVVTNCEAAGVVVTWSAGNEGTSGLRSPAIYQLNPTQIFSVGAVDASSYPTTPYPAAGFTSQGPTPCTPNPGSIKPEIAAPGVNVYSSWNNGAYNTISGTSMAGPHVAGCVALMRQACPNCDPTTIKTALMNTAIDAGYPPAGEDNVFGAGFIDCYNAVLAVSNLGHLVGTVLDISNNPLAGATVRNVNGLQSTQTNGSGQYDLPLSAGTYSISFAKFGYVTQQVNGLVITTGQNTTQNVNLATAPTGTVSGTVTSCSGGPAVGATVTILNTPISPVTTNASGFYSVPNVPQGTYDMQASGAGCGSQTVNGVAIGANTTQNFTLPADPHFLCSAPDGAQYVACEDGDVNGPTFAWLEISPGAGGPGTLTGITNDDQALAITIPFTFRHYGTNYTNVYASSNGLLTFTSANSAFTETQLSSLGQPGIAAFWDDLYPPSGGDISSYRYTQGGTDAFIIEWRAIPHFGGGGPYTFQVWLYNFVTNPGDNGNSRIRLQYQSMNGVTSATVGTTGGTAPNTNQYVYDNTYDANAQGLQNNRAITYGGAGASQTGTLQGTITSCAGGPAAGATVSFPGSGYPDMTTDGAGFYSVSVFPGTYTVRASNSTCSAVQSAGNVVNENQVTTVNLTLDAPGTLQGTVTSCVGGAAAGASVSLAGGPFTPAPTTTNGAGFYQFAQLPAGTYAVIIGYAPCNPDTTTGVVISSGSTTTLNRTLSGADVVETPADTVHASAPAGGTTSQLLHICNLGVSALNWSIAFTQITPTAAASASTGVEPYVISLSPDESMGVNKTADVDERGRDQLDAQGGPDAFGYRWIDSDEPGGPAYSWVECVNVGVNTGLTGDDQVVSVALPFTFTYYGNAYNSVWISSNGNVQFGATASTAYTNQTLPSTSSPANMIAPFWDDLYLPTGGSVWYLNDAPNGRFVVQWDTIPHITGATNRYTFEVILENTNRFTMQYQRLDGFVNSCTVGQQNATQNDGLLMVFNATYLHASQAITIGSMPPWLTFGSPTSGSLTQNQCTDVTLNFDAGTMPTGTYAGLLSTASNDPDENPYVVQVRFSVGQLEAPDSLTVYYTAAGNQLQFRWTPALGAISYVVMSATTPDGPFNTVVGTTSSTQLAIPYPGTSRIFYQVLAQSASPAASAPIAPMMPVEIK